MLNIFIGFALLAFIFAYLAININKVTNDNRFFPLIFVFLVLSLIYITMTSDVIYRNWNITVNKSSTDWDLFVDEAGDSMSGDLYVAGNITGNQIHGEMWLIGNGSEVVFRTINVYENITDFNTTYLNGFHNITNYSLTADVAGLYLVNYHVDFNGSTGVTEEYGFGVGINGVENDEVHSHRTSSKSGAIGSTFGTGFILLDIGDEVTLMARDENSPLRDIFVVSSNINLVRIGD